jgi:hypothetical protein
MDPHQPLLKCVNFFFRLAHLDILIRQYISLEFDHLPILSILTSSYQRTDICRSVGLVGRLWNQISHGCTFEPPLLAHPTSSQAQRMRIKLYHKRR